MGYGEPLSSDGQLKGRDGIDLLARMIYGEAENQSEKGKRGVAFIAYNRKQKNTTEFGGNTWEGVLLKGFDGIRSSRALKPDTSSQAWKDSLDIAQNLSSKDNPIGTCLWHNTIAVYNAHIRNAGGQGGPEQYAFQNNDYRDVVEKRTIENHVFFRVSGY